MKPTIRLRHFLFASSVLVTINSASAQATYYWNQNGTAAGWGAIGTWNTTNAFFSTTNSDTATAAAATTTTSDTLNVGTSTVGFVGGDITVSGTRNIGTINIGSANTAGTNFTGAGTYFLNFAASGTFTNNASALSFLGTTSGAATRLDLNAGSGGITLFSSASTHSGITYVNTGTVTSNNAASLGASGSDGNRTVVASGARLSFNNNVTYSERFEIAGAGVGGTTGALNNAQTTILNGSITLSGAATIFNSATLTLGGGIALGGNALTFLSSGTTTVQTTGISNGSMIKSGAGTLNLNSASSYAGGTTLNAGTLAIGAAISGANSAIGSTSGTLTVNGGTLNMAANNVTVGNLTGSGGVISGTSGTRLLTIGQGNTGGGDFQGQINNGAGGTTALTKTDNGTITLSGTNGYSGGTIVSGGKLTISSTGTINGTSGVSIGAGEFNYNSSTALTKSVSFSGTGGTLSGSSTVNPSVTVTTDNTLAIGNSSVGVMNFGSNMELGGIFLYEVNNTTNTADLGDVAGNLTFGGILDLVQLGTYALGDKFTLFAYDGSLSGLLRDSVGFANIADDANFTDGGGSWKLNYNDTTAGLNGGVSASNTYVTITAIPEPNAAALLGGLGMLALLRRRR